MHQAEWERIMARGQTDEEAELAKALGRRIRARRLELGMAGPRDLARRVEPENYVNLGRQLSSIELGEYMPRLPLLLKLAQGLDATVSFLIGDHDEDEIWRHGHRQGLLDASTAITALLREK